MLEKTLRAKKKKGPKPKKGAKPNDRYKSIPNEKVHLLSTDSVRELNYRYIMHKEKDMTAYEDEADSIIPNEYRAAK